MPIYEYHCKACGANIEKLQKLSDDPLVICAECGQPELKKKISAAGFRLSGSGWYETDFKKSDKKKNVAGGESGSEKTGGEQTKAEGGKASEGGNGKSDSGKTDSKTDTKADKPFASTTATPKTNT